MFGGNLTRRGYDLWAEVINEQGGVEVGGERFQVEMFYGDDQSNPATGADAAERLIRALEAGRAAATKRVSQALVWFDKAVEQNPTAYWIHHQRANALAKLGRKADAIAAANKSKELALKAQNGDYVTLNDKLIGSLK